MHALGVHGKHLRLALSGGQLLGEAGGAGRWRTISRSSDLPKLPFDRILELSDRIMMDEDGRIEKDARPTAHT